MKNGISSVLKKYVQNFLSRFRRGGRGSTLVPSRDWHIMLVLFVVVNMLIVAASVYLYMQINSGDFFVIEPQKEEPVAPFSREKLNATLQYFQEKEIQYEKLGEQAPQIPNPR